MTIPVSNIYLGIPPQLPTELCQTLLSTSGIRVERIVSKGHCSPPDFWYDQAQDEWVMLLQGQAALRFSDHTYLELKTGDYLLIPAHCRHQLVWTDPDSETIWLTMHIL